MAKKTKKAVEPDLGVVAQRAREWFDRHGTLPAIWNKRRVTGRMIADGADYEALRAAGLDVPPREALGRAGFGGAA